jgi:hypothetical protein
MKNNKIIKENDLPNKYKVANDQYRKLIRNPPDLNKSEPIEIYNWFKKLVELTKV